MSVRLTRAKSNKENQTPSKTLSKKSSRKGSKVAVALEADFDSEPFSEDSGEALKTRSTRKLHFLKSLTEGSGDEFRFKSPKSKPLKFDPDTSNSTEDDELPRSKRGKKKKVLSKNLEENLDHTSSAKKKSKRLKVRTTMELNQWPTVQADNTAVQVQQDQPKKKKKAKRNTNFLPRLDYLDEDILKTTKPRKTNKSQSQTFEDDLLADPDTKLNSLKPFEGLYSIEDKPGNKAVKESPTNASMSLKENKAHSSEKSYKKMKKQKSNLKLLSDKEGFKMYNNLESNKTSNQNSKKKSSSLLLKDDLLENSDKKPSSLTSRQDSFELDFKEEKVEHIDAKKSLTNANTSLKENKTDSPKATHKNKKMQEEAPKTYQKLRADIIETKTSNQNSKNKSSNVLLKDDLLENSDKKPSSLTSRQDTFELDSKEEKVEHIDAKKSLTNANTSLKENKIDSPKATHKNKKMQEEGRKTYQKVRADIIETKTSNQNSKNKSSNVLLKDDLLENSDKKPSSLTSRQDIYQLDSVQDKAENKVAKISLITANTSLKENEADSSEVSDKSRKKQKRDLKLTSGEEGVKQNKNINSDASENEISYQKIQNKSSDVFLKYEQLTNPNVSKSEKKSANSFQNHKSLESDDEIKESTSIHKVSEDSFSEYPTKTEIDNDDDDCIFLRNSASASEYPRYSRLKTKSLTSENEALEEGSSIKYSMANSKNGVRKSLKSNSLISIGTSSGSKTSSIISISDSEDEVLTQDESFVTANGDSVLKMSNIAEKECASSFKEIPVFRKKSRKGSKKLNEGLDKAINKKTLLKESSKKLSISISDVSERSGRKSRTPVSKLTRSNPFCVDQVDLRPSRSMSDIKSLDSSSSVDTSDGSVMVITDSDISWNAPNPRTQKSLRNCVTNKNHVESLKRNAFNEVLDLSEINIRKSSVTSEASDSDISWHAQNRKTTISDEDVASISEDPTNPNPNRATYNADISISKLRNFDSKRKTIDSNNHNSQNTRRNTYKVDIDISAPKNIDKLNNSQTRKSKRNKSSDTSNEFSNIATPDSKINSDDGEMSQRNITNKMKSKRKTLEADSSTQNPKRIAYSSEIDDVSIFELNGTDESFENSFDADTSTKNPKRNTYNADISISEINNDDKLRTSSKNDFSKSKQKTSKAGSYIKGPKRNADILIPEFNSNGNSKRNTLNDSTKTNRKTFDADSSTNIFSNSEKSSDTFTKSSTKKSKINTDTSGNISKIRRSTFSSDGSIDATQNTKRDTYSTGKLKSKKNSFDNGKRGTFTIDDLPLNSDADEPKRRTFELNEFSFDFSKSSSKKLKKSSDRKLSEKRRHSVHGNTPNPVKKPTSSKKESSSGQNGLVEDLIDSEIPDESPVDHSLLNYLNITYRNRKRRYVLSVSEEEVQAKISKTSKGSLKNPRDIFDLIERDALEVDCRISEANGDSVLLSDSLVSEVCDQNPNSTEISTSFRGQNENQDSSPIERGKPLSGNLLTVACDSPGGRTPRKKWEVSKIAEQRKSSVSFFYTEDSLLNESKGFSPQTTNQVTIPQCASPAGKSPRKKWNISQIMENSRRSRVSFLIGNDSLLNQSKDQSLIGNTTFPSMTSTPHSTVKTADKSLLRKVLSNKKEKIITKNLTSKKMPDFASIHKRAFEKMENIQEMRRRKDARAQFLLSGQKPADSTSLLHKSGADSRKQLNFNNKVETSANMSKTEQKLTAKNKRKSLGKAEQLHLQKQKKNSVNRGIEIQQNKRRSLEKVAKKNEILSKIPHKHVPVSSKIPKPVNLKPTNVSSHQSNVKAIGKMTSVTSQVSDVKATISKPSNARAIPRPIFVVPKIESQNRSTANKKKVGVSTKSVATKSRGDDSSIFDRSKKAMIVVRSNRRFELLLKMREQKKK